MTCIWFELLCRVVPFTGLRLRFCRRHVERCLRCQQESDSMGTLPPLLVTAEQLSNDIDLWHRVREGIASKPLVAAGPETIPLPAHRPWRWAYAATLVILLLLAGFWTVFFRRQAEPQPEPLAVRPAIQTRVCSASIENRPARVFLIQSRNPDRAIFWIARNNTGS
jgi:hypothetical protein